MKNKSIKKNIINVIIILVILSIVLYLALKDNYKEIINYIINMNPLYYIIAIAFMILEKIITAIIMKRIAKINNYKYRMKKSIETNLIVPFFNGITPFAGGGQPMTVYYLHDEGIPYGIASNIVLQTFIVYQTSFIVLGFISVVINKIVNVFPPNSLIKKLVILGFSINLLVWIFSVFISISKKFSTKIKRIIVKIINRIKLIKNKDKIEEKLTNYINSFYENTTTLKNNKYTLFKLIILNIFGLVCLYSIPFIIALGMGEINPNYIKFVVMVIYVYIMGSFVPIPGGTGGIEYGFVYFASYVLTGNVVTAIMLIWRFITYYLAMIIGAITMMLYRKREEK